MIKEIKKKKFIWMIIVGIVLIIGIGGCRGAIFQFNEETIYIKWSLFHKFSYLIYDDHVTLVKYHGDEAEVTIPDTFWGKPVTRLDAFCFYKNETLCVVKLPKDLEFIGANAFLECSQLKRVVGGEKVKTIHVGAFGSCENLNEIGELGKSVEEIYNFAFSDCESLTYFPFTENLKYLCYGAFTGSGIERVDEVSSVEHLERAVFFGTPWLEQQEEDFVIYNDILIAYKGQEKKVVIPEGVKGIAVSFADTEGIEEIYVPSSVEYIRRGCLTFCKGIRIYIPKEVEKIGYEVCYDGRIELRSIDDSSEYGSGSGNVIVTTAGSPAEAHAKEFGIPCEIVEGW